MNVLILVIVVLFGWLLFGLPGLLVGLVLACVVLASR